MPWLLMYFLQEKSGAIVSNDIDLVFSICDVIKSKRLRYHLST